MILSVITGTTDITNMIINAIGICIVIILILSNRQKNLEVFTERKLFVYICLGFLLMHIFWIEFVIINKPDFAGLAVIKYVPITGILTVSVITEAVWILYTCSYISKRRYNMKKITFILSVPTFILITLFLVSCFIPILYDLSSGVVLLKNNLYWFPYGTSVVSGLVSLVILFKNKDRLRKSELNVFVFSNVIVLCTGILQFFFRNYYFQCLGFTISLLFLYIKVQDASIYTDFLTGLSNRQQLEEYLYYTFSHNRKDETIIGMMIDIDDFKYINDNYGHLIGDKVLSDVGHILLTQTKNKDFAARYAGDEFIYIFKVHNDEEVNKKIEEIDEAFIVYNENSQNGFAVRYSLNWNVYDNYNDVHGFLQEIDRKMYEVKNRRKNNLK